MRIEHHKGRNSGNKDCNGPQPLVGATIIIRLFSILIAVLSPPLGFELLLKHLDFLLILQFLLLPFLLFLDLPNLVHFFLLFLTDLVTLNNGFTGSYRDAREILLDTFTLAENFDLLVARFSILAFSSMAVIDTSMSAWIL